jgi:hypothetical protein
MKWAQKNKNALLWALTIIVIILIIILSKPGDRADKKDIKNEESEETTGEQTSSEPAEITAADGNKYDFSGVQWEFDTEDPSVPEGQTWVKMRFADFARNGNVITLRNPYKLGFHPGVCAEVDFVDTTGVEGVPLAYAKCTDGATTRDFAVLQQMDNVVVKYMDTKDGVSNPNWSDLYSIDVTTIVK